MPIAQARLLAGEYMVIGGRASARAAAAQAAAQANAYMMQQQSIASLYGVGLQNMAPTVPARVNRLGQTQRQWIDGLNARIGMMEACGIPMGAAEIAVWEAEYSAWKTR